MNTKIENNEIENNETENIRTMFQAAIDLSISNAQGVWEIHNVMLLANTILIGTSTLLLNNNTTPKIISLLISVVGLVIVFLWFVQARRARKYADYYILSAREIEEKYFESHLNMLERGGRFSDGKRIEFIFKTQKKAVMLNKVDEYGRIITSSYVIELVFASFYVCLLIFSIINM